MLMDFIFVRFVMFVKETIVVTKLHTYHDSPKDK